MFKNNGGSQNDLNGFLDRGARLQGELSFESSFRIDGRFQGKITSAGRLIVGEGGEVDAEVHVRHVAVSGLLRGSIKADEQIHIAAGGRVEADLDTPSLLIEDGALFDGRCTMRREPDTGETVPKLVSRGSSVPDT